MAKQKTNIVPIANAKTPAVVKSSLGWPETSERGTPRRGSMMNVRKAVDLLRLEVGYDVFTGRYTVNGTDLERFHGEINDKVTRKLRELSFQKLRYEPGAEAAREGLMRACEERMYNSLQNYLDGLEWDGTSRLDTWLVDYLGVEDTPLHRAWGRIVLLAAVRRVYDPGCKFDHVLVLEGGEGTDKSSTVQALACGHVGDKPEYFSDSGILHKTEKEQQELTLGVWFYEIAELAGMRKADQHAVKAFITRQEERARPAYGYFKENQPRVAIFIGTFNTDANTGDVVEYLNPGDRRRWWPVKVGKIDIEKLLRDRDQLFAEAVIEAQVLGASIKLDPSLWSDAAEVQKKREVTDVVADKLTPLFDQVIAEWESKMQTDDVKLGTLITDDFVWVSSWYVLKQVPPTMANANRISTAMSKLGWHARKARPEGANEKQRGYARARKSQ
jgi:hypothetical protein